MNRRKFVIGAGSIVGGTAAAAAFAGTGAAAHSEASYVGSVNLESDTGEIDYVAMYGDSTMEWKGLDTPAQYVEIVTSASVYDSDDNPISGAQDIHLNSTGLVDLSQGSDWGNHDEELSGPGTRGYVKTGVGLDDSGNPDPSIEWVIVGEKPNGVEGSDYGLPANSIDSSVFTVSEDGSQKTYYVVVETKYILYDENENQLITAESAQNINVTVGNIAEQTQTGDGPENDGASGGASNNGTTLS